MQQRHAPQPRHIDVKKDRGLTIQWDDGRVAFYSVARLRKLSPSADMRALREEMAKNPLTVLPSSASAGGQSKLTITDVQPVGRYAIRIVFSDGHDTGIYSWEYLNEIPPETPSDAPPNASPA